MDWTRPHYDEAVVLALSVHAGYACRQSGACCTAGWPIPVETDVARRISDDRRLPRLESGPPDPAAPPGIAGVIQPGPDGSCPYFERDPDRRCAIQRRLGHESLPAACRHFPRVALLEPDAVRVTLSHFCPTAASMLFREDIGPLRVVPDAAGIADRGDHEGFDARETIPPLLRPGVATDAETCRTWERFLIGTFAADGLAPEDALARVALAADAVRTWDARLSTLAVHAGRTLADAPGKASAGASGSPGSPVPRSASGARPAQRWAMPFAHQARLFLLAAESVPAGLQRPGLAADLEDASRRWVQPAWPDMRRPVGRFLAAHAFGAWSAYLGDGLRSQVASLAVALAVLRVEAARQAAAASRPLDAPLLHAAFRSADLLLRHLSNAGALVRSLAGVERVASAAMMPALGLEPAP